MNNHVVRSFPFLPTYTITREKEGENEDEQEKEAQLHWENWPKCHIDLQLRKRFLRLQSCFCEVERNCIYHFVNFFFVVGCI